MPTGGYDEGYMACSKFWGTKPAEMVTSAIEIFGGGRGYRAVDLGCGDGKNAAALAGAGFQVVALDKSEIAVSNAMSNYAEADVNWLIGDLREVMGPKQSYDLVIATGSLHCLNSGKEIEASIRNMQGMTKLGGLNLVSSFNSGPQDLRGHDSGFNPTLVPHELYLDLYRREHWEILYETDVIQVDVHPHNQIEHSHSITRIMARRKT